MILAGLVGFSLGILTTLLWVWWGGRWVERNQGPRTMSVERLNKYPDLS